MFDNDNQNAPFIIPFVVAIAFGTPIAVLWYMIAMNAGFVATIITILMGCACGFGARISAGGWHAVEAAILSTLLMIALSLSAITISILASASEQSILATVVSIITQGNYVDFTNGLVLVAGRTFMGYPLGLYAAYKVSDTD